MGTLRYYKGGLSLNDIMNMNVSDFEEIQKITHDWIKQEEKEIAKASRGK